MEVEGELQFVCKTLNVLVSLYPFLERLHFLHLLLCVLLVFPEVWSLCAELFFLELHAFLVDIKIMMECFSALHHIL